MVELWISATLIKSKTGDCSQHTCIVETGSMLAGLTGVSVLEADLARAECAIDDGSQVGVEGLGAVQESDVLLAREVLVGAADGVCTARRCLKPAIVLAAGAAGRESQRNQLVSVQRAGDIAAVAESLGAEAGADGRIEALQEAGGRVLKHWSTS